MLGEPFALHFRDFPVAAHPDPLLPALNDFDDHANLPGGEVLVRVTRLGVVRVQAQLLAVIYVVGWGGDDVLPSLVVGASGVPVAGGFAAR